MKGRSSNSLFFLSALCVMALGVLKVWLMGDSIRDA